MLLLGFNAAFSQNQSDNNLEIIKEYLLTSGMNENDLSDLKIQSEAFSKSMNVTNVYINQQYNGITIKNVVGNFAIRSGKVVHFSGKLVTDMRARINAVTAVLSPENSVRKAAVALDLEGIRDVKVLSKSSSNKLMISKSNVSVDEIPVELVYELVEEKLILAWDLSIHTLDGKNWYSVRIDAQDGTLINQSDWILKCTFDDHYLHNSTSKKNIGTSFSMIKSEESANMLMTPSYRVFSLPSVESPSHGSRTLVSGQEDLTASPFGWHDTNGVAGAEFTTTRGNNVLASENTNASGNIGAQPDGGTELIFDYPLDLDAPFVQYQEASTTNLF